VQAAVHFITTGIMLALLAGIAMKLKIVRVFRWARFRHEVVRRVDDLSDDPRSELGLEARRCLRRPRGEQE